MAEFVIPSFTGGINEAVDYSLLQPNEAQKAQNCNIDKGVLSNCKGYSLFSSQLSSGSIKTIMTYYKNNEAILILAANGSLYKIQSGVLSLIASGFSSDYWDYVNNNVNSEDVVILTNGVDPIKVYNNTTLRNLKGAGIDSSELAPKGKYIDLHYERLWVCDDNSIYFSTANANGFDIDDFTAPVEPEEEVNQHGGEIFLYTNDGSKIIGMRVIFDDIILYKEKSMYKIFGTDPSNYQKVQIFSAAGGIADRSIAVSEKGSFHIDAKGIYFYDGVNITLISQKLNDTFTKLNRTYLNNACGYIWNNKYILAVPEGASTVNNLIIEYDIDNQNFMLKRGFEVSSFVDHGDNLLFVGADNRIYKYSDTNTFNGNPIECYWESGYTTVGYPNANKEFESLYFTSFGSGQLKIDITTERGTKTKIVTLTASEKVNIINLSSMGRLFKIKFSNVSGSTFTLKSPKIIMDIDVD